MHPFAISNVCISKLIPEGLVNTWLERWLIGIRNKGDVIVKWQALQTILGASLRASPFLSCNTKRVRESGCATLLGGRSSLSSATGLFSFSSGAGVLSALSGLSVPVSVLSVIEHNFGLHST